MTDTIRRLRHHAKNAVAAKSLEPEYLHEVFGRAADEIEQLNKRHADFLQEFWVTNAENERLRGLIQQACKGYDFDCYCSNPSQCRERIGILLEAKTTKGNDRE